MKVIIRKVHKFDGSLALFLADTEGLDVSDLGTVCLSRKKPGGCNFTLDALHEHDYHAPTFTSEEEMEEYIDRVQEDIRSLLENSGAEVEVVKVDLASPSTNGYGGTVEDEDEG